MCQRRGRRVRRAQRYNPARRATGAIAGDGAARSARWVPVEDQRAIGAEADTGINVLSSGWLREVLAMRLSLMDRVVDIPPTLYRLDVTVDRGEVRAHRHDGYVASTSFTPRRNVSGPLVVAATILLNRTRSRMHQHLCPARAA